MTLRPWKAAVLMLCAAFASAASAEVAELTSVDGNLKMVVELVSYDDENYTVVPSEGGEAMTVPRAMVTCVGAACPPEASIATAEQSEAEPEPDYAERRPADLTMVGSDSVGDELMPLILAPYAELLGGALSEPVRVGKKIVQYSIRDHGGTGEEILLLEIESTSSGPGLEALIAGDAQVAMSSREAEDDEVAALETLGRGNLHDVAQEYIVAVDTVLMIVHASNPVDALSRQQLADIYSGKIRNWAEVGGAELPSMAVGRDGGSARANFEQWALDGNPTLAPDLVVIDSGKELTQFIMSEPFAIGYTISDNVMAAKPIDLILDCGIRMDSAFFKAKAEEYLLNRRIRL